MPRQKKNVIKVTYTIDEAVAKKVDKYNVETDVPKSKIVEKALKEFFEKHKESR